MEQFAPRKSMIFSFSDIFDESDRKKCLIKFESLIRHLNQNEQLSNASCCQSGGRCHDINQLVITVIDNLLKLSVNSDLKFEQLLYTIPWTQYLFSHGPDFNRLKCEIFSKLLIEYVQIFPNKSDKFLSNFLFILRGNNLLYDDEIMISDVEIEVFSQIRSTIQLLLGEVGNFELSLKNSLKKRYPFYHNSCVHEFICYIYNLIHISELLSLESSYEIIEFIFSNLLQIDVKEFYDELIDHVNKENIMFDFEDLSSTQPVTTTIQTETAEESIKKLKVLNSTFKLLFDYIDSKLDDEENSKAKTLFEIFTSIFFQRMLAANSLHLQYLVFYLCGRSRIYCDTLVNDLWTIATDSSNLLQIREGSFSYLMTLFFNARFIPISTIYSFLKILVQWLNSYLDLKMQSPPSTDIFSDNDVMYFINCIGCCQMFCTFHQDMERLQIECLKNLDLKRALMNTQYNPLQYFNSDLLTQFLSLATHYRIGYFSVHQIRPRTLNRISSTYIDNPPTFGKIKLPNVKSRIGPYLRDIESVYEIFNDQLCKANSTKFNHSLAHRRTTSSSSKMSISLNGSTSFNKSIAMMATSPTTNTSDDGIISSPNGNVTPNSSLIMSKMLSDIETME